MTNAILPNDAPLPALPAGEVFRKRVFWPILLFVVPIYGGLLGTGLFLETARWWRDPSLPRTFGGYAEHTLVPLFWFAGLVGMVALILIPQRVVVTGQGVESVTPFGRGFLAWEAVDGAVLHVVRGVPYVTLHGTAPNGRRTRFTLDFGGLDRPATLARLVGEHVPAAVDLPDLAPFATLLRNVEADSARRGQKQR
jgi:hypothetical protein